MRVAGLCVELPTRARPLVRLVVIDDVSGTPAIVACEPYPGQDADLATQLHNAAEAVRSRLTAFGVDRVVLRRADRPPRPTNEDGPRVRLLVEGAVASAARSVVFDTRIGTGKDTGAWFGSNKKGVDQQSSAMLDSLGESRSFVEATSAALSAIRLQVNRDAPTE